MKVNKSIGIDIGGTNVKIGVISEIGEILEFGIYSTSSFIETGDFMNRLLEIISEMNIRDVCWIGLALPGLLCNERQVACYVTAIPELNNINIYNILSNAFPTKQIIIENDANAAAYGEYSNVKEKSNHSLLLVTMGTGIGSGLIVKGSVFTGGDGNALELGDSLCCNDARLESLIGIDGIHKRGLAITTELNGKAIQNCPPSKSVEIIISSANEGNIIAQDILFETGEILGKALVNAILMFDISNIVIGGGVSEGFEFINNGIKHSLNKYLSSYYSNKIKVSKARLANNAGIIGAALLCMDNHK